MSTYNLDLLYQAKRKCNATQEHDIDLYEGEVVAVMEQKDPFGSSSRWLVDSGGESLCAVRYRDIDHPVSVCKLKLGNTHQN